METIANIQVSDAYGRSKRATQTYSGLLAILCFTKPISTNIAWSGIEISLQAAEGLAWCASAYFLIGFVLEWRNALRNNSQLILQGKAANLNARLEELSDHFDTITPAVGDIIVRFKETTDKWSKWLSSSTQRDIVDEAINKTDSNFRATGIIKTGAYDDLLRNRVAAQINEIDSKVSEMKSEVEKTSTYLRGTIQNVHQDLQKLRTDFGKLSNSFSFEQRAAFHVYDLWVTTIFFCAVTLFAAFGGVCIFEQCSTTVKFI